MSFMSSVAKCHYVERHYYNDAHYNDTLHTMSFMPNVAKCHYVERHNNECSCAEQGDQIGRFFVNWATLGSSLQF